MGGTGMKLILTIAVTSLALAGCAGDYDTAENANLCEPATPAGTIQDFLVSNIGNIPARRLLASGKLDLDDSTAYACIDPKSKTNAPEVPNPHMIRLDH